MKKQTVRHLPQMVLFIGLGASLFLISCKKEENTYVPPPPPLVTVDQPYTREVIEYAGYTGTTVAVSTVEIRARVEGELTGIHFKGGDRVKKGDLLFTIDPRPFQAKLTKARADLNQQQANLNLAQTTVKRRKAAFKDRAVSEVELIEARATRDSAKAAVSAAKSEIALAKLNLSYTRIFAPQSGRISRRLVDLGNLVGAGERTLLTTITRDDKMYVYFNISETDLISFRQSNLLTSGSDSNTREPIIPITLTIGRTTPYSLKGELDYVDSHVDMASGTIQVRGVFPNPDHVLLPGLFVYIRLPLGEPSNRFLVPDPALGADQRGSFLYVVGEDNKVSYRPVETGQKDGGLRVIYNGLKAEDRVIINGISRIRPGIEVIPEMTKHPELVKEREKKKGAGNV